MPAEWLQKRISGVAAANGEYGDIYISEWISRLRRGTGWTLDDMGASALQKTARRMLSQLVSRIVLYAGVSGITMFRNTAMTSRDGALVWTFSYYGCEKPSRFV